MRKVLVFLGILALGLAFAQVRTFDQIKKSGEIRIGTEGAFPPFNYFDEKNQLTGFEVDLGNAIAKKLGLKPKWIAQAFDSLLIQLNQGRFDFVIASHGITEERAKAVDFTNPHYCTGGIIVSKKGGPKTKKDLEGKVVGVQIGTTYMEAAQKIPGVKEVRTYQKDPEALQDLPGGPHRCLDHRPLRGQGGHQGKKAGGDPPAWASWFSKSGWPWRWPRATRASWTPSTRPWPT
jgi:polar amino acid transport system substrate-binding protein